MAKLTTEQVQELKTVIRTGEPIASIADRMAPKYNRKPSSFRITLYNLAKRTRKVAEWNGPKRRRTKNTVSQRETMPNVMRTRLLTGMVEAHKDHIRIYF
jgi:hypothetical protein